MCDTLVALNNATADGSVILAKNSDREPNEAQQIVLIQAAEHSKDSRVKCTYIEVPQVEHTYRVLLSKPYWMWGAEMGANEHGVAIGNEAVFTKVPQRRDLALTGMDLLRLALERAKTAEEAVDWITQLLERYGQGGSGSPSHEFLYHNSFLIADSHSAWRLETAGPQWAAKKESGVCSISNAITLGDEWDKASDGLVDEARKKGWTAGKDKFDFSKDYSDTFYTWVSYARHRCARSRELLEEKKGKLSVVDLFQILRDHGGPKDPDGYTPARGFIGAEVCMHLGGGPVRSAVGQTTGSMVAHLSSRGMTVWVTGTAAPCTSIFKPVWLVEGLPDQGVPAGEKFDPEALWWQHEVLHREVMQDYAHRLPIYKEERDQIEMKFMQQAGEMLDCPKEQRLAYSEECFDEAKRATERWTEAVQRSGVQTPAPWLFRSTWKNLNRKVGIPG